jgi:hypothetical protein
MQQVDSTRSSQATEARWGRADTVTHLAALEAEPLFSIREYARQTGIPRSTLQDWRTRKASLDASPAVRDFFESPDGLAILHRIVGAAHFVFGQVGAAGIRLLLTFLEVSHLDRFVASSFGSQQAVSRRVEQVIGDFGDQERVRLSPTMPQRAISIAQDETFHPETCLVAIEPVSNFILVECYSERRDAATWTATMTEALDGLPVQVVQATSDEAKGLLSHARDGLGVTHSPDLFHVQREISSGTQSALSARTREAEAVRAQAEAALEIASAARARFDDSATKRGPGRRPEFEKRIAQRDHMLTTAREAEAAATARQRRMREAVVGLSSDYHPWDLKTGLARSSQHLHEAIEQRFLEMDDIVTEAGLSEKATTHLDKAWRVVDAMIATMEFVHLRVRARIEELKLGADLERVVLEVLVPSQYLRQAGAKAAKAETRAEVRGVAEGLEAEWEQRGGAASISAEVRAQIEQVARECAGLFQRSSSCVEGRNGQLALRHHSLHRLSAGKLKALTVVHNFFLERVDGTTAAERFFGSRPGNLFECILDHIEVPVRPAKPRSVRRLRAVA